MQVQVWKGKATRTEYALPPVSEDSCDDCTAPVSIGGGSLLCLRLDSDYPAIVDISEWSKDKGMVKLDVKVVGGDAFDGSFTPVRQDSRKLLWVNGDIDEGEMNGKACVLVLPQSFKGEFRAASATFQTTDGTEWDIIYLDVGVVCGAVDSIKLLHMDENGMLTIATTSLDALAAGTKMIKVDMNAQSIHASVPRTKTSVSPKTTVELCTNRDEIYAVGLSTLKVRRAPGTTTVYYSGLEKHIAADTQDMRVFSGMGPDKRDIYASGNGRLFYFDRSEQRWFDVRVQDCDWTGADLMTMSKDWDVLSMYAITDTVGTSTARSLIVTEVCPQLLELPTLTDPAVYSDEDVEQMHDVVLRVGPTDFKIIAAPFIHASGSYVLRSMLFGSFQESIRGPKRAKTYNLVDLTELVGDDHATFERLCQYAMSGYKEWFETLKTIVEIAQAYRMAHALGMVNVMAFLDDDIQRRYLSQDHVLDVVREIELTYAGPWLKDRCVEAIFELVPNGSRSEWARVKQASAEWAEECMKYTRRSM